MDPADLMELLKLVGALRSCQGKNTNPLRRMKASGELMDFIEDYPVFAAVAELSPILEEAERINQAAVEEVFGRRPARAAAAMLGADSAEPAAMPKPTDTAMLQPADAAMPQPAATSKPTGAATSKPAATQHAAAAEVVLHQHPAAAEVVLHQHPADAAMLQRADAAMLQPADAAMLR